ncbi:MAG TPA: hypothetical protein VGB37_16565 [Candidatus Lokiarchaeia archaeon]
MPNQNELLESVKNLLADLLYVNSIIATELIKITENTVAMRRGEDFLNKSSCVVEHNNLNKNVIAIVKKYCDKKENVADLEKHVLKH